MPVRQCGSRSIGNEASCLSQRRGPSGRRGLPGLSVGQARGSPGSRGHDAVLHRALRQPGRFAHRGGSGHSSAGREPGGRSRVHQGAAGEIVFTSGATESNNLALIGHAHRNKRVGDHVVISEVEHISLHNVGKYLEKEDFRVTKVPPDQYGRINPQKLRSRITDETILVSVGWASNEIGTVQPIQEIAEMLNGTGVALHVDAVAAEGLLPIDVAEVPVNLLTLSSNDVYGPQGLGALYIRKGTRLAAVTMGGGQERGLRSGTENLPAIVGMAKAAEIAAEEQAAEAARLAALRDRLVIEVLSTIPDCHLNGHPEELLPNNAHFRFAGIEGESLLLSIKDEGVLVSTGSACSSKTLEPSHTLISCGLLHEEAHGSLEFTFGRFSKEDDIDRVM